MIRTIESRFWNKVEKTPSCWNWIAGLRGNGYGRFTINGESITAHRFSYELIRGPIPIGLQLDHLCRNIRCVNPDHLEPVTCRENLLRGNTLAAIAVKKTHCPNGHELITENLIHFTKRKYGRACKICHKISQRKYAERTQHD